MGAFYIFKGASVYENFIPDHKVPLLPVIPRGTSWRIGWRVWELECKTERCQEGGDRTLPTVGEGCKAIEERDNQLGERSKVGSGGLSPPRGGKKLPGGLLGELLEGVKGYEKYQQEVTEIDGPFFEYGFSTCKKQFQAQGYPLAGEEPCFLILPLLCAGPSVQGEEPSP
ncbi:UNVERIFIED_CONTAM: hypothetical protein Sindi_0918900 [Sesamum indicum]